MKPLFISASALLAFAAAYAAVGARPQPAAWRTSHFENVLGTSMELKLVAVSDRVADRAEAAALAEIARLNAVLSGYDAASEFSRWAATRNQPVPVSSELFETLQLWDLWRARTSGALNPAAEAIGRVWQQAEKSGRVPVESEMAAAAAVAAPSHWKLDPSAQTATHLDAAPLMLNSFTKSYIIERAAAAALRIPGVTSVIVNIGGDLVLRGPAADSVAVTDPRADAENSAPLAVLRLANRAVATSGDYRRGYTIAGRHYSHIVDPRTGHTADAIAGATVVAPNAVDAGALATAFCVLSPAESRELAASIPGVDYLLVTADGAQFTSANWSLLETAASAAVRSTGTTAAAQAAPSQNRAVMSFAAQAKGGPATAGAAWDPSFELTINVELPQSQGFGARRPYLAVWIEDKDHFPVRTLTVWFDKTRYLNELRAWYRDDRLRAMAEGSEILSSVTSATRAPGKYSFQWDGKDNAGKYVKQGLYTILVEASREHGGNNVDRREINCSGAPVQAQASAEGELGAVSFDYHKVAR